MKRFLVPTLLLFVASAAFGQGQKDAQTPNSHMKADPPALGIHWARGAAHTGQARSRTPNMTYHNGPIMKNVYTQAIFWGTSWPSYSGDEITGIDTFYNGINGTQYARTVDEFTSTSQSNGSGTLTYGGHLVDNSAASGGQNTGTIGAEVCKVIGTNAVSNGYYPVYTDLPRGSAQYCAWHSNATCNGVNVKIGFFWKMDGDSGCNPRAPSPDRPKDFRLRQTSAVTKCPKCVTILSATPGTTAADLRTLTSAHGTSELRRSPSATAASGRCKATGRTGLTTTAPVTPTTAVSTAASMAATINCPLQ